MLAGQLGDKFAVTDDTASSASTPTRTCSQADVDSSSSRRRRPSGPATSRRPSRPASTSSPRSRSPSTAPASALPRVLRGGEEEEPRARHRHPATAITPATSRSIKRVHDGQIGDIVAERLLLQRRRPLAEGPRSPSWSDLEYQMRNWLYYTWLSGDHIVEQASTTSTRSTGSCAANPVARRRHRRPPGPDRARVRPHLRPLRRRLRVPERRPRLDVHAAAGQHRQEGRQRSGRHHRPRLHPAEVLHHRGERRGRSRARSTTPTSPSTRT